MEAPTSPSLPESTRTDVLVQTLQRQRSQVDAFLAAHRKRLLAAEANLTAQIDRIARDLVEARSQASDAEGDGAERVEELKRETHAAALLQEQFEAAQTAWQSAQDQASQRQQKLAEQLERQHETLETRLAELSSRQLKLAEAEATLRHERESFTLERQRHEEEVQRLEAERERLGQQRAELDAQREELAAQRTHTEGQRRRIAREFESQRTAHRKQVERHRAEVEQLADERAALQAQRDATPAPTSAGDSDDEKEFRRRYEMALDDLRELRAQNEDLQKQLAEPRSVGTSKNAHSPEPLDWEGQKRLLLEALEADFDENDEETTQERLTIKQVIEKTDRVIAEKNHEIEELQTLLREQSSQVGNVAVGAAAFAEAIDQDAIVQEERENLKRLHEELREKLRNAEIDISIERAKISRQRLDLEEKLRTQADSEAEATESDDRQSAEKATRGRWLSRLGIKDGDEGGE